MVTLRTDAAFRPVAGIAGAAYIITDEDVLIEACGLPLPPTTNNKAEYQALIMGLVAAYSASIFNLNVEMDSKLIVEQLSQRYKVRSVGLQELYAVALDLAGRFNNITFTHIPREKNWVADALAGEAARAGEKVYLKVSDEWYQEKILSSR